VRKVVRRTTILINFPRQCLQWFLKIDQSECSKSPIDLHQSTSSSLPLSILPSHPPPHYLSPSFLPILLLTTSLPLLYFSLSLLSSSSLPTSLIPLPEEGGREVMRRKDRNEGEEGGRELVRSRMEKKEIER
jgi:hypothetical protein